MRNRATKNTYRKEKVVENLVIVMLLLILVAIISFTVSVWRILKAPKPRDPQFNFAALKELAARVTLTQDSVSTVVEAMVILGIPVTAEQEVMERIGRNGGCVQKNLNALKAAELGIKKHLDNIASLDESTKELSGYLALFHPEEEPPA